MPTDDFIVTAKSKRLLVEKVKPAVEEFLAKRGLILSEEKTVITHIRDGFTFLGQPVQRANLPQVWPKAAHQAISRRSQSPHGEGGDVNQKICRRADGYPDQEAQSGASRLGR